MKEKIIAAFKKNAPYPLSNVAVVCQGFPEKDCVSIAIKMDSNQPVERAYSIMILHRKLPVYGELITRLEHDELTQLLKPHYERYVNELVNTL